MEPKAVLRARIQEIKEQREAVILAHNYQPGEIQDLADFVGDSLELSQKAAQTKAAVIVFCGVHFMAETAAILSPTKTVLLPDPQAGCPLADTITAAQLRAEKEKHPGAAVVCYVNSTASVKAESDVCCTSANGVQVVNALQDRKEIIFVPDQHLGSFVAAQTGRQLILWPGFCPVHVNISPEEIVALKRSHPLAKVVVHPECPPPVRELADAVLSTGGMIRYARETEASEVIVGTEIGLLHRLEKENPGKVFIPASPQAVCPSMKLITLEKVLKSLELMTPVVRVPEETRLRAKAAVDQMLACV